MFTCILRLNMDTKIGFIGLGLMGKPMVMRLLSAGYSVTVNNRSQSSVSELVSKGAINASTHKEVALSSDVVITMLPDAPDVEKVILDKNGLIESDTSLTIIDMSTISYDSTLKISLSGIDVNLPIDSALDITSTVHSAKSDTILASFFVLPIF